MSIGECVLGLRETGAIFFLNLCERRRLIRKFSPMRGLHRLWRNPWRQLVQVLWPQWVWNFFLVIARFEIVPIYLACQVWAKEWFGERLIIYTDNTTVLHALQNFSSKHTGIMEMIRKIYFCAPSKNFSTQNWSHTRCRWQCSWCFI